MTAVEAYEDCRRRYMEASWHLKSAEDYKKWRDSRPIFQNELATHVGVLLRLQHTGDAEVMHSLGDAFEIGLGVEKNREEAIDRFRVASQAGHTIAMVRLGRILGNRNGLNQLEEARYWYQKAAEGGNTSGMVSLGFAFREGYGVPVDRVKAAEWFSKAVEGGHKRAKYFLAKVYYYSLNSTDKALPLLLDEAESENNDAFWTLGRIYSDDRTNYYDFEKAAYWYERIANGKYAGSAAAARIALAELYLSGRRQPKNLSKAKQYLEEVISTSPESAGFWKDALNLLGKIEKGKA